MLAFRYSLERLSCMRVDRFLAWVTVLGLAAAVTGCAVAPPSSPVTPTSPTVAVSPLAGNWLLNGSLPNTSSATSLAASSGATATFDVQGQTVTAVGTFRFVCPTGTLSVIFQVFLPAG